MLDGLCNCQEDGFCSRYQRPMTGRFREICAGINVDLGTAAAFRTEWAREAAQQPSTPSYTTPLPQEAYGNVVSEKTSNVNSVDSDFLRKRDGGCSRLLLRMGQAPGDAVAMTAAIYSLHKAHPGRYDTAVESYWPEVFAHNPDVSEHLLPSTDNLRPGVAEVRMHYPAVQQSNERAIHFMQGWCEFLGSALGISMPLLTNRPHIYFGSTPVPSTEDFWLICSGGKRDFTNKLWGQHNYQKVIDLLRGRVKFVQVGGARHPAFWDAQTTRSQEDSHPRLQGVEDMIGRTTLRELFDLVRISRGVLCGVSLLMHVAAALERPAVVLAGGREPVAWNAYPKQQYVHTVGSLPCTSISGETGGACWRSRVVPLGDGTALDNHTCLYPVNGTPTSLAQLIVPKCMSLIRPEEVAVLVLRYNRG